MSPSAASDAGGPGQNLVNGTTAPAPRTGHQDSFLFMHVQGQAGVLVHVTFVLRYTLRGPQVPQLDLREEARGTAKEGPAGTLVNPRNEGGQVLSKHLFLLEKSKPPNPEAETPSKAPEPV